MKTKKEIKLLAQKIADLELNYTQNPNPDFLKKMEELINKISLEEFYQLDKEIQKILKNKGQN